MDPLLHDAYALQIDHDPNNPNINTIKQSIEKLKQKAITKDRKQWSKKFELVEENSE